jgi:ribosomal protein L11 methyltransferase
VSGERRPTGPGSLGKLVRLGIRVRADLAELTLANLLPLLGDGAEERDLGGSVEYAVYLPEGELPPPEAVRALGGEGVLGTLTEPVTGDWRRSYLEHLRPVRAGALTIRPPWLDGSPDDIVIDPDTMFGAGTHESTRLSLELLQRMTPIPPAPLCDWGSGSGVLAIAAARLGWGPVTALELDPDAAPVIAANALANGVEVEVHAAFDLLEVQPPWAPTVLANLTPVLHREVSARLQRRPERLIAAGFLARYADDVAPLYAPLREVDRAVEGEWAAVSLA